MGGIAYIKKEDLEQIIKLFGLTIPYFAGHSDPERRKIAIRMKIILAKIDGDKK